MMKQTRKYKVLVARTAYADIEIEATNKSEACRLATDKAHQTIGLNDYSDWGDFKAQDVTEIND